METIRWDRVCSAMLVGAIVLVPPQALAEPPESPEAPIGRVASNSPVTLTAEEPPTETAEPAGEAESTRPANGPVIADPSPGADELGEQIDLKKTVVVEPVFQPPARELEPIGKDTGVFHLGSYSSSEQIEASQAGEGGGGLTELLRVGGALAIVLGILFALGYLGRKMSGLRTRAGRPAGILEILARYPLGKGHHLLLLKLDRRVLLVHQSGSSMATLTELSDPTDVASLLSRIEASSPGRGRKGFQARLSEASSRYSGEHADTPETVDLTRSHGTGLFRVFRRRQVAT